MIHLYRQKYRLLMDSQFKKYDMNFCPIYFQLKDRYRTPDSLHHYRIHNTKINRKRYPLLIDSLLNLVPVYNAYHINNSSWRKITEYNADKIELFLFNHPKAERFVNHLEPINYFRGIK